MNNKSIKDKLKNILSGKGSFSNGEPIQAIASYLRESTKTSAMAETKQYNKEKETEKLIEYINTNNLWNCNIDFSLFISEGAEQRVFIQNKNK